MPVATSPQVMTTQGAPPDIVKCLLGNNIILGWELQVFGLLDKQRTLKTLKWDYLKGFFFTNMGQTSKVNFMLQIKVRIEFRFPESWHEQDSKFLVCLHWGLRTIQLVGVGWCDATSKARHCVEGVALTRDSRPKTPRNCKDHRSQGSQADRKFQKALDKGGTKVFVTPTTKSSHQCHH